MKNENAGRHGLKCKKCGATFGLTQGWEPADFVQQLREPFHAKCHACGHLDSYQKAAIEPFP